MLKILSTIYLFFFFQQFTEDSAPTETHRLTRMTTNCLDTHAQGVKNKNTESTASWRRCYILTRRLISNSDLLCRGKNMFGDSCAQILSRAFILSSISQEYGCFCGATSPFSQGSLCAGRECVLFVFMHMNSIRWMPMIRWLKFPFRVHILHKTVQLSVHELRAGYVCVRLKACPTVPPSNSERGGLWGVGVRRGRGRIVF